MSAEQTGPKGKRETSKIVLLCQYFIPISFTMVMAGTIAWIISLIMLSQELDDVPSASIGISIVAIPVFLVLLSVFWYVFLGIIRNQEEDEPDRADAGDVASVEGVEE